MESCKVTLDFNESKQIAFWVVETKGYFLSIPMKLADVNRKCLDGLINLQGRVDVKFGSLMIIKRPVSREVIFECGQLNVVVPLETCLKAFSELDKLVSKSESISVQVDTIGAEYDCKSKTLEFSWYVDGTREVQSKRFLLDPSTHTYVDDDCRLLSFQINGKRRADGDWEVIKFEIGMHTLTLKYGDVAMILDMDRVQHALDDLKTDCLHA